MGALIIGVKYKGMNYDLDNSLVEYVKRVIFR